MRSCTGVSERRYAGTPAGRRPRTDANAPFFAEVVPSIRISFSTSQPATSRVPPYRPAVPPSTRRTTFTAAVSATVGVVTGGAELSLAVDSVKGSGPDLFAAWRK